MRRHLHEQNRRSWNHATRAHNAHKRDQAGFLRRGGSTLFPEELELLGDLASQQLVHLQCNAGQDTLSLAALGADVLGVDISDEAVDFARQLSADSGIAGRFERADVYDWLARAPGTSADLVFCSYGWMGWLSDLPTWARGVARILRPGARFVAVEFHPVIFTLDAEGKVEWPLHSEEPLACDEGISDYVGTAEGALSPSGHLETADFANPEATWEFAHSTIDLFRALLDSGLVLERLEEWPFSNGCDPWGACRVDQARRMWPPEPLKGFPMMFGVSARKPA